MLALAFILGVIIGNATKAHLYVAVCNHFQKAMRNKEKRIQGHIKAKNELRKELERRH